MFIDLQVLLDMASDLLDVIPDGWSRSIYRDGCKLSEECGEVNEALLKSTKTDEDLGDELADVICTCCAIALKKNIDLEEALVRKHKERLNKRLRFYLGGRFPEGFIPRVPIK